MALDSFIQRPAVMSAESRTDADVVIDTEGWKRPRNLKRTRQSQVADSMRIQPGDVFSLKENPAGRRRIGPGNDIEKGGLASPIGAGDTENLLPLYGNIHTGQRFDSPKRLGYFPGFKNHKCLS